MNTKINIDYLEKPNLNQIIGKNKKIDLNIIDSQKNTKGLMGKKHKRNKLKSKSLNKKPLNKDKDWDISLSSD